MTDAARLFRDLVSVDLVSVGLVSGQTVDLVSVQVKRTAEIGDLTDEITTLMSLTSKKGEKRRFKLA